MPCFVEAKAATNVPSKTTKAPSPVAIKATLKAFKDDTLAFTALMELPKPLDNLLTDMQKTSVSLTISPKVPTYFSASSLAFLVAAAALFRSLIASFYASVSLSVEAVTLSRLLAVSLAPVSLTLINTVSSDCAIIS